LMTIPGGCLGFLPSTVFLMYNKPLVILLRYLESIWIERKIRRQGSLQHSNFCGGILGPVTWRIIPGLGYVLSNPYLETMKRPFGRGTLKGSHNPT